MLSRITALLLTFGVLLSCARARAYDVVIVGDSHSQVLGPLLVEEYSIRGHSATYIAHAGWSSRSYRLHPQSLVQLGHVDVAVIILGGNNRVLNSLEYLRNALWVVSELRSHGAQQILWFGPLWCTAPEYQQHHISTRLLQRRLLSDYDVVWHDTYAPTRRYQLRHGGVHFTYRSYYRIVRDVFVPTLFQ